MHLYRAAIENLFNDIKRKNKNIGETFHLLQRSLPAFDFYVSKPDTMSRQQYIQPFMSKITAFRQEYNGLIIKCDKLILEAMEASWMGSPEQAMVLYKILIEEKYPFHKPSDMLISLYQKQKDRQNELAELTRAIDFFSDLKAQQREYVLSLAADNNITAKVKGLIDGGQKIMYYADAFTLYDPAPFLDKWKKRLNILNQAN
jgi:hypothetical protein